MDWREAALDTDSFMTAAAIMRMVRVIQSDPKLGILQGLVVGLPSTSAFARIFQFGMRLGMRSYTIGSAWWQGDCGPYWGHNAVLRLEPFIAHCALPAGAVGDRDAGAPRDRGPGPGHRADDEGQGQLQLRRDQHRGGQHRIVAAGAVVQVAAQPHAQEAADLVREECEPRQHREIADAEDLRDDAVGRRYRRQPEQADRDGQPAPPDLVLSDPATILPIS